MQLDGQTIVMAGGMVLGAVIWFVRLEGRVNTQDKLYERLREDVTYIRERIDAALNGR